MPRIAPEIAQKVRDLYGLRDWLGGVTADEIARALGISPPTVRRILNGAPPAPPLDAPTYTVPQVARLLRMSPESVRTAIVNGTLRASNLGQSRPRWIITQPDLMAFLAARQPEPPRKTSRRIKRRPDDRY